MASWAPRCGGGGAGVAFAKGELEGEGEGAAAGGADVAASCLRRSIIRAMAEPTSLPGTRRCSPEDCATGDGDGEGEGEPEPGWGTFRTGGGREGSKFMLADLGMPLPAVVVVDVGDNAAPRTGGGGAGWRVGGVAASSPVNS